MSAAADAAASERERENGANDAEYLRLRTHWTELQCCLFSHGNVCM